MVNKQKILRAFEERAPNGYLTVIRAGDPSRRTGIQRTIPSDNTYFESRGSKPVGEAGRSGAELLAGGASQNLVEIIVVKPIGQLAAVVGRCEHYHPPEVFNLVR